MREFFHIIKYLIQDYAFTLERHVYALRHSQPPSHWLEGTKGDMVIIHGYGEVWTHWERIATHFNEKGYRIHFLKELGRNLESLENTCPRVSNYITTHNLQNIILLSHSKGGIIAKCILDTQPEKIKYSITLAVPYGGTIFGYFRLNNLGEAIPGKIWTTEISKENKYNHKIYNFYPKFDNHILPNKHLTLPGAHNKKLSIIGHANIMRADETIEEIDKMLSLY